MSSHSPAMCVVIHDVAPATWRACQNLLQTLSRHGDFPVTLLAVPRYHGLPSSPAFERWLRRREAGGDEVALHGYYHLDVGRPRGMIDHIRRRVVTRGEGEFSDLDFEAAAARMQAGRGWLADLGILPAGFVAPAWLLGAQAWRALRGQPFEYTCTVRRLYLLDPIRPTEPLRSIVCQSQVYSNASLWRRQLSCVWTATLAWRQRGDPLIRLELHPGDEQALVQRSWERLLSRQSRTRSLCTLGEVARQLRKSPMAALS
ncbi:MAG TPA: polysaccharide deacetylase family protein [Burkholderiaceae bacterium]|jgi:hypothetical protein|nr:polysaccharide deacetylase family protein [Burkholderiaceae bacterium]